MASQTYKVEVDVGDDILKFRTTHFTYGLYVDLPSTRDLRELAFPDSSTDPRSEDNDKEQERLASFEDSLSKLYCCLTIRQSVGSTLLAITTYLKLAKILRIIGYGKKDGVGHPAITSWKRYVSDLIDKIAALKEEHERLAVEFGATW